MSDAFAQLDQLVSATFALNAEAIQAMIALPHSLLAALLVVVLAGLSLEISQMIILFINRVKPARFLFSLIINAILLTCGFIFLVFSTWLICQFPGSVRVPFLTLIKVLGLSYAPLLFSFLGALPYLGTTLLTLLSVWRLLAAVVGFGAVAGVSAAAAFGYVAIGWFVLQLLERTIGQPIAHLGKEIADRVAGVDLISRSELMEQILEGLGPASPLAPSVPANSSAQSFAVSSGTPFGIRDETLPGTQGNAQVNRINRPARTTSASANLLSQLSQKTRHIPQPVKLLGVLSLLGMVVLFGITALLLRPIRYSLFAWHDNLSGVLQLLFDLAWIGLVALVFAGILAPLETLGWWAGWYGDRLKTVQTTTVQAATGQGELAEPAYISEPPVGRYVIYLDGVGQSGEAYTPDVETFLDALEPALPPDVDLVRGLMMYSVLNKPLDEDRPLAAIWRLADKVRWSNPSALLGILVNLRNVLIVAVSADKRYGPIYNQGIAQVLYNGLIARGYPLKSGMPITLIGYSGGGEMSVAAAPYLRRAIDAPIEVISLGGVMSANNNILKLEHLYHLVGQRDGVERMGPIMFPGRWKLFPLSYWNRAKRRGKITLVSLEAVGHQVPGGYMDPDARLEDGRTYLQQTIQTIVQILYYKLLEASAYLPRKTSNYDCYKQAAFNDFSYYPIHQPVNSNWYHPIAPWMGRLILPQPDQRLTLRGVWFEVHHAPAGYESWVGQTVKLGWVNTPRVKRLVRTVTSDIHFSADAEYTSEFDGLVHPERLNHWRNVGPLESLAGAHPTDDLVVMLEGEVQVETRPPTLRIATQPVQITGRYYGLVQFIMPLTGDQFQVVHFNPNTRQFDGPTEIVRLPEVVIAPSYGSAPSTSRDLEKSPLNERGWYIYGAKNGAQDSAKNSAKNGAQDTQGQFVVQSLGPRALFRLQPDEVLFGPKAAYKYIRQRTWADLAQQKGRIASVLCSPRTDEAIQAAINDWQEGDRALVLHTYGGIGGDKAEPAAATPIFFGHFAYGLARVVRDPLANELRFDIQYYQVYTHNTDGLVAGTLHWSRYLGDRQFGWLGVRPTCDILIKLEAFTGDYTLNWAAQNQSHRTPIQVSPLDTMISQLQVMTARYRTGDGTGGTYVGPANNCSQDSNQALFASIQIIERTLRADPALLQALCNSNQRQRFEQLMQLDKALKRKLQPLGGPRLDWENNELNLGSTLEDEPLQNLWTGLGSWRTMLPRLASDTIVKLFLDQGADVWVLRTNQVGGHDPNITPIAPMTL